MEQDSEKDEPVPTGDTRIIIEGEGMLETSTRSSEDVYKRQGQVSLPHKEKSLLSAPPVSPSPIPQPLCEIRCV